jgi:phosphoesterase RecJ-like protein
LLLERMSMGQMRLLQRGLSRLTFTDDGRIAWLWITSEDLAETGASNEDMEGLVNYPRNIDGVEVGMLFKENGTASVKVSLRSAGKVNVAEVARHFGGGGHVRAAGCRLTITLAEAVSQVVTRVQSELENA